MEKGLKQFDKYVDKDKAHIAIGLGEILITEKELREEYDLEVRSKRQL